MARQKSIITLQGEIDGISFYKGKNGYFARKKSAVSGDRIKTDPSFIRTRENLSEFGRAGKAGKALRHALRSLSVGTADSEVTGRLTKEMMRILKTDPTGLRGQRTVANGELGLLQGFNFNSNATLGSTLFAQYTTDIDRVAGTCVITVPAFQPSKMVSTPEGATHFRFTAGIAQVNFETGKYDADIAFSSEIVATAVAPVQAGLTIPFEPANTDPLFLAFGIEFMQLVNGQQYPLNNGGFNCLTLVQVDLPV